MKYEITKERILEAASKCSTAKATLEVLFPEAFESPAKKVVKRIFIYESWELEGREVLSRFLGNAISCQNVDLIPGKNRDEQIDNVVVALAEKFNWK